MVPLRMHDDQEVVAWCRAGRTEMTIGGESVELLPGEAVWISPGTPHSALMDVDTVQVAAFLSPDPLSTPPDAPHWVLLRAASELIGMLLEIAHVDSFAWPVLSGHERRTLHTAIRAAFFGAVPASAAAQELPSLRWSSYTRRPFLLSCSRGSASVSFGAPGERTREVRIGRDQALALPEGLTYLVQTSPGTVVTPTIVRQSSADPALITPRLIHMPTSLRAELHYSEFAWVSAMTPTEGAEIEPGIALPAALTDVALSEFDEGSPLWRVQRIQHTLHNQPGHRATVADWAAHFGIGVRTVESAFTSHTEVSFADWRRELRMRRANDWLDEGRQAKWISYELGFAHLSAFSRAYRNHTGMTPRDRQAAAREMLLRVR